MKISGLLVMFLALAVVGTSPLFPLETSGSGGVTPAVEQSSLCERSATEAASPVLPGAVPDPVWLYPCPSGPSCQGDFDCREMCPYICQPDHLPCYYTDGYCHFTCHVCVC
ncbi:MAG TPA: hypothetical protein VGX68_04890 [Thermoanaerobaculia bacterium]|nr:hypothetical protein [Thermoanaerobaculia bacterium]